MPPGWLGEGNPDLRKVDADSHGLNAGLSQDMDGPVVLMGIIIAYVVFFPLAFWLLWRTDKLSRLIKISLSSVMAVGIMVALGYFLMSR